jgi:hypothetical protein
MARRPVVAGERLVQAGYSYEIGNDPSQLVLDRLAPVGVEIGAQEINRHVDDKPAQKEGAPEARSSAVMDVVNAGIWILSNPMMPLRKKN